MPHVHVKNNPSDVRSNSNPNCPTVVQGGRGGGGGRTPHLVEFFKCCSFSRQFYLQWKALDLLYKINYIWGVVALFGACWCVIFHAKHKLPFLVVLTWFLILGKMQDCSQDGDHCWWRHRPPAAAPPMKYTSSCYEDQRLSRKGKIISKFWNISKTPGRSSIQSPPRPLVSRSGYEFACTSEGWL